ncbi:MAG: hypothetical protein MI741_17555, partial [Rhodospirillales bacterium]|nr:hypothetical protein [Rhodospirillales bacterium]
PKLVGQTLPLERDTAKQPDDAAASRESNQRLWSIAREELSGVQFDMLWLHYVEGVALKDVATMTGRSAVSVRTALFRARQKLMPRLRPFLEKAPVEVASKLRAAKPANPANDTGPADGTDSALEAAS